MRAVVAAAIAAVVVGSAARAEEGFFPLVISGDWGAAEHRPSMTAPPDICLAMNGAAGFAFRADSYGVQIRITNNSWSLPPHVKGSVLIQIGNQQKQLEIDDNTSDMLDIPVSNEDTIFLLTTMDNSAIMTVTVGKAKPLAVSLVGSTRVTNAFRTCAGINSNAKTPGGNPFE